MPGAVGRTSTLALTNATMPYAVRLASLGWEAACVADPALAAGLATTGGSIVHAETAATFPHLVG
jgi:alanine dehydrogenase